MGRQSRPRLSTEAFGCRKRTTLFAPTRCGNHAESRSQAQRDKTGFLQGPSTGNGPGLSPRADTNCCRVRGEAGRIKSPVRIADKTVRDSASPRLFGPWACSFYPSPVAIQFSWRMILMQSELCSIAQIFRSNSEDAGKREFPCSACDRRFWHLLPFSFSPRAAVGIHSGITVAAAMNVAATNAAGVWLHPIVVLLRFVRQRPCSRPQPARDAFRRRLWLLSLMHHLSARRHGSYLS